MKKILSLLALLMLCIVGANAQTTIYSWESPEGTPVETGGTIAYVNGDGDRLNYLNSGNYTICLNGKKANLNDETASANAGKMVITLDQELQTGDEIAITAYITKNSSGVKSSAYIVFETGTATESAVFSDEANIYEGFNGSPKTVTVTVPEEAAGSKTITMTRGQTGTNLFITKLVITGERSSGETYTVGANVNGAGANMDLTLAENTTLPYTATFADCYRAAMGGEPAAMIQVQNAEITSGTNVTLGTLNGWDTTFTINEEGTSVISLALNIGAMTITVNVTKDGSEEEPVVETKTITLVPGPWDVENITERYAAYVWAEGQDAVWIDFEEVDEQLTAAIPTQYTGLILARMDGETAENNWGNVWNQTADIDFTAVADKTVFTITGWGEGENPKSTYTTGTAPEEPVLNTYTANLATNYGWAKVYAYAWSGEGEDAVKFLGDWPGTELTGMAIPGQEGIYGYQVTIQAENAPEKIIFNNGVDAQTGDLEFVNGKNYYLLTQLDQLISAIEAATKLNEQLKDDNLATAIEEANTAVNAEILNKDDLVAAATNLQAAALAAVKPALQAAITQAEQLNAYANDENLAAAITAANEALNGNDAEAILGAAQTLMVAATTAAKAVLGEAVTLAKTFGINTDAADAVLAKENATAQELKDALENLVTAAKNDAATMLTTAQNFFKTFDGNAAKDLEGDFAAAAAALEGTDVSAMISAAQALMAKATPAAKNAMEKVMDYFEVIQDEPIKTDVAALKAAMEANNLQGIFAAVEQLKKDFPAAASTYFASVQAIAQNKTYGENGLEALNAAISAAQAALTAEDATIVTVGLAIRNLALAVTNYKEANSTFTVVGSKSLTGTEEDWAVVEANKMVLKETGLFTWTAKNITISEESQPEFKVLKTDVEDNETWYPSGDNWKITPEVVGGEGDYDITITFNTVTELIDVKGTKVDQPALNTYTATFTTDYGWEKVYAYAWSGEGENVTKFLGDWPGTELTANEGVYTVTIEAEAAPQFIIFNDGGSNQTADLAFENGKAYEYNKPEPVIAAGKYYLVAMELEDNNLMAAGLNYGTQGIVNDKGLDLEFIYNESTNTYTIETRVSNGGDNHFLGSNLFMDSSAFAWSIEEDAVYGHCIYAMFDGVKKYIAVGLDSRLTLSEAPYAWGFFYADMWEANVKTEGLTAMQAATAENPVDATFLIKSNDFNRNDQRNYDAWSMEAGHKNLGGGCSASNGNGCAESYHSTFTLSQILADAPAGVYALTAQGFYRQDGSDEYNKPYFYANDERGYFPLLSGSENNMDQAGVSFAAGSYTIDPIFVEVTEAGALTVGAKLETNTTLWCIWDNFQLKYYGTEANIDQLKNAELLKEMQELVAEAEALKAKVSDETALTGLNNAIAQAGEATGAEAIQAAIDALKAAITAGEKSRFFVYNGTAYVISADEEGLMMAAGHDWGTRGIVNELGLDLIFTANEETNKVTIDSRVSNGSNNHFLGSNLYMDSSAYEWGLEEQDFGFYISDAEGKYISIDAQNNLVMSDTPHTWLIVTADGVKEERMSELALATKDAPKDATFLLLNPNFNRNDQRVSAWTIDPSDANHNFNGGDNVNNCAESYHAAATIKQTVEGAPAGFYELTAQGFYRQDNNAEENAPVFYANGVNGDVPAMGTLTDHSGNGQNGMDDASVEFANGNYTIDPIPFEVTEDGMIYVGVAIEGTNQWVIWDNFQLKYYGTEKPVVEEYATGDANGDGEVTTSDAVLAVDFALEKSEPTEAQFKAADVNNSNDITVSDAVGIVTIALEINADPSPEAGARMDAGINYLTMNGQTVSLTNSIGFAGFQMDVTLTNGAMLNGVQLTERAAGMTMSYNRISGNTWRIIAFSLQGNTISGNDGALLKLDITGNSTISISKVEFADAAARAYALGFNGEATGISLIGFDTADADIYNVNGVHTNSVKKGMNIIRNAKGEVKKVFVK